VYYILSIGFRRIFEEPILALQQPECDEDQRFIGEDCAKQLADLTSQFVLRRTQEVMSAHLPPKVESVIFCKPSSLQVILKLYKSAFLNFLFNINSP